jgi:hypothetical protein
LIVLALPDWARAPMLVMIRRLVNRSFIELEYGLFENPSKQRDSPSFSLYKC